MVYGIKINGLYLWYVVKSAWSSFPAYLDSTPVKIWEQIQKKLKKKRKLEYIEKAIKTRSQIEFLRNQVLQKTYQLASPTRLSPCIGNSCKIMQILCKRILFTFFMYLTRAKFSKVCPLDLFYRYFSLSGMLFPEFLRFRPRKLSTIFNLNLALWHYKINSQTRKQSQARHTRSGQSRSTNSPADTVNSRKP